jgi:biotin carboxyl carrier protein
MKNEYFVKISGKQYNISILNDHEILFKDKIINFELIKTDQQVYSLRFNNKVHEIIYSKIDSEMINLNINGFQVETLTRTALQEKAVKLLEESKSTHQHNLEIHAPMPGIILKIKKQAGQQVNKGESILILEAMKMENEIKAPLSGIIIKMNILEGKAVEKNDLLFSIG